MVGSAPITAEDVASIVASLDGAAPAVRAIVREELEAVVGRLRRHHCAHQDDARALRATVESFEAVIAKLAEA